MGYVNYSTKILQVTLGLLICGNMQAVFCFNNNTSLICVGTFWDTQALTRKNYCILPPPFKKVPHKHDLLNERTYTVKVVWVYDF